ncbi:MAG: terpene cyclase/mutase family protein [Planctomycetaceae bacterium]|nr:terpene cyclase/mutase family protein [Planctomycetaceae bacterium]
MKSIIFAIFCVFSTVCVSVYAAESAPSEKMSFPLAAEGVRLVELESKPTPEQIRRSIGRAAQYLIEKQNPKGSWGSARNTKELNIYAPESSHDAYLAGTTALGLAALLETEAMLKKESGADFGIDPGALTKAINKGEEWLLTNLSKLRRSSSDVIYNIWGHAYGLQALVRMLDRFPDDEARCEKIRSAMQEQIGYIERFECLNGGWCYYDFEHKMQKNAGSPCCFVSAAVLLALWDAKQHGADVPQRIVDRALASNLRQRYPDFSYAYGEYLRLRPMQGINRPPGSLARSQSCNLAARHWGDKDMTDEVLENWLNRMFSRNGWLDIGRKRPIPHESWAQVAGYFYYYGVLYAAFCIEELPQDKRAPYQDHLASLLIERQGIDGSWFDYPLYDYGHAYATGYGLMALLRALR